MPSDSDHPPARAIDEHPAGTADATPSAHYFDPSPGVASDPVVVDVSLPDVAFAMETDRGVFSHGHLDAATSLLLRTELPLAAEGDVLDLGCGSGAIAMTMARRSPATRVWAIDVNERARQLCRRNAARNALTNVEVVAPDDVPPDVRFRTIWSNPPIRIGKPALHDLLRRWLTLLDGDGTAALVVQKHLGADSLQKWLTTQGWSCSRVASKSGFRVLAIDGGDGGDVATVERAE